MLAVRRSSPFLAPAPLTMNAFPDEADLLRSEARLQDLLGHRDTAVQLLEKAWMKMPRGSGVAKQLAKRYLARNNIDGALGVLNVALDRQPTDRSLNLMIANILFSQAGDINNGKAVDFLKASFVSGDREYWGRFVRAGPMSRATMAKRKSSSMT